MASRTASPDVISEQRLREIADQPTRASPAEIVHLATELLRSRPAHAFVAESLKAIYINAKDEVPRTLVLDVITAAARSCIKRLKLARH
jgi:hypothetical protein